MLDCIREVRLPTVKEVNRLMQFTGCWNVHKLILVNTEGVYGLAEVPSGDDRVTAVGTLTPASTSQWISCLHLVFVVKDEVKHLFKQGSSYKIASLRVTAATMLLLEPQGEADIAATCIADGILMSEAPVLHSPDRKAINQLCTPRKSYKLTVCPGCGRVHCLAHKKLSKHGACVVTCDNCDTRFAYASSLVLGLMHYFTPDRVELPKYTSEGIDTPMRNGRVSTLMIDGKPVAMADVKVKTLQFIMENPYDSLETVLERSLGEGWNQVDAEALTKAINKQRTPRKWSKLTDEDVENFVKALTSDTL